MRTPVTRMTSSNGGPRSHSFERLEASSCSARPHNRKVAAPMTPTTKCPTRQGTLGTTERERREGTTSYQRRHGAHGVTAAIYTYLVREGGKDGFFDAARRPSEKNKVGSLIFRMWLLYICRLRSPGGLHLPFAPKKKASFPSL